MIVAPGCFSRNASASSAVMKSPEMNSPVPSMKKQRSASPSQAMPMSAFSAMTRSTMSRRFSSMSGLASWFGKRPSISKHSRVVRQGSRSNSFGATSPPMPLPASSTTLNGRMTPGSMNDMHVLDVGVERRLCVVTRAAARRAAAAVVSAAIMSRMSRDALVAAQRERLAAAPSSCRCTASGLCEAVTSTPPSCPSRATAKYSMSVGIMP